MVVLYIVGSPDLGVRVRIEGGGGWRRGNKP